MGKFSFASRFNKTSFGIDTTNFKYVKLADLFAQGGADTIHGVNGFFVHKTSLGESPVCIDETNHLLVNFPAHTTEVVREILADSEAIEAIKAGKVCYTIYEYDSHGKKCYGVNFVDK